MFAEGCSLGMLVAMDTVRLNEVLDCFSLDEQATSELIRFYELVRDDIPSIVDEFCAYLIRDPAIARRSEGKQLNLHCLKHSVIGWLQSTLSGPHTGETFLASRKRIGKVHVQIELPQEMMFTAMNCLRSRLLMIALTGIEDTARRDATLLAVNRVLDLELALMLESYREHQQDQIKTHERLATIGQLAASIGHELRNPLGTIETSVYLMAQRLEKLGVKRRRCPAPRRKGPQAGATMFQDHH